ncbi:thiol-disulfide isomerase/thioredoxin [Weissella uvarum]|uniref:thioredoxin family protein n=1 Tax=Weissella uvarum TaxID=1479233 RepID=UPI00196221AB|nr:thioredoxin family protein [Weissella uvarum]MBM7617466.1 thiol-disulfide isomerase/thioredoxin [Weissella uvarum]MCM0595649.1 thioredoxin family protein [Weissella uvarum]
MEFYEPTAHTDEEIRSTIANNDKVMLFLQADWCGDCKAIKPFVKDLRSLAESNGYTWIDADRDDNIDIANALGLRGIPAFVQIENGKMIDHIGNGERLNPADVKQWLENL